MMDQIRDIIHSIRAFNRYYTWKIGLLNNRLYGTDFSLTEARMIFHAEENQGVTAGEIASFLNLDPGYTSRVIKKLTDAGILSKEKSGKDTRSYHLSLSPKGKKVLADLEKISGDFIESILSPLTVSEKLEVLSAMEKISTLLEKNETRADIYTLRTMKPGDLGYVAASHALLYAAEYQFDHTFEFYVGEAVMAFAKKFDPEKEALWIAENRFRRMGSIAIVNNGNGVAQLRWLLVEAAGRGCGLGEKLVETAVGFAREKKYEKIILMTIDFLTPARRIYEKFGFAMVSSEKTVEWGREMSIEYLELKL
ncbi:MAG: hypothetical protein A2097_04180 [Desulfobacula sp. GWF2_41_7]|nr:MAG: hypothetical protein A2097_04180 [Desulfobacula sp. GWF2_41_7]